MATAAEQPPRKPVLPKEVREIRFDDLWSRYPNHDPCVNPSTGKKAHDNQCAIRLGMALEKSGVSFSGFPGRRCEFGPRGNGMALRAKELADWLATRPFKECPAAVVLTGKTFVEVMNGRTGIAYFEDYWFRDAAAKYPTGDHIDLWRYDRLTPSFETFMRFTLGVSEFPNLFGPGNWFSDLSNSRRVLFWSIA